MFFRASARVRNAGRRGTSANENLEETMKFTKSASVEELQVTSRFESLRKILLSKDYVDHLTKPLAYWALPTDRRLPLAPAGTDP